MHDHDSNNSNHDDGGGNGHGRRQSKSNFACLICADECRDRRGLRDHFVVCVERNGNPGARRWDDGLEGRVGGGGVGDRYV